MIIKKRGVEDVDVGAALRGRPEFGVGADPRACPEIKGRPELKIQPQKTGQPHRVAPTRTLVPLVLLLLGLSLILPLPLSLRGGKADEAIPPHIPSLAKGGGGDLRLPRTLRVLATTPSSAFAATSKEPEVKKEDIAAEVNNLPITKKEVYDLVSATVPRITGHKTLPEERMRYFRTQALNQLIDAEIFYQEAKKKKLKAEKVEIDEELKKIQNRYRDEKGFNEDIKKKGLTINEIRKGLERHILINKIIKMKEKEIDEKVVVKDEDLLPYYEKNKEKFILPEQIRIRQILLSVDPGASEQEWMEIKKRADEISGRAKKGEDFAKLAKEFSDDPDTKDRGGDVGLMHRGRMHLPEIEELAFSLKVGDISQPVRIIYGWLVIKAEEKRPEKRLQFSELNKDLLRSELLTSARKRHKEEWLQGLRERADIKIYEME